jgi:putative transposase
MDFVSDALANGRRLKRLTVTDDFAHECVDIAADHGIEHLLIEGGRPMQNGYIERSNGKFRGECLNGHWFTTLAQARDVIAEWRRHYHEARPHNSRSRIPPAQFAANHRSQKHRIEIHFKPGFCQ